MLVRAVGNHAVENVIATFLGAPKHDGKGGLAVRGINRRQGKEPVECGPAEFLAPVSALYERDQLLAAYPEQAEVIAALT